METRKIDIPFFKYVSMGNDFIVIENIDISPTQIKKMCLEKWGISADGILLLKKEKEQWKLTIYNADGSKAKMCGNGLKVIGAYLKRKEPNQNEWDVYIDKRKYHIKKERQGISVQVPFPKRIKIENHEVVYNVGNLHRIIESVWDDALEVQIAKAHPKENISFYQIIKEGRIAIRTFERGVGFTYSCGSASLAVAAHYFKMHPQIKKVSIITRGGIYKIEKNKHDLLLKGKVKCVFIGRYINEVS
jgi:diaminopimelate epimerase